MPKLLAVILALSFSGLAWADFDRGLAAYRSGDHELAFREFQESAIAGHATAQFNLGVMYYRGEGVERDLSRAYGWIELATQQRGSEDLIEAQEVLSVMLSAEEIEQGIDNAERLARIHGLKFSRSRSESGHSRIATR